MIQKSLCLALSTALLATPSLARQEPAAPPPSAAARKAAAPELSGELVRLFPDRTVAYVEVAHLGSLVGALGPEPLLEVANAALRAGPGAGEPRNNNDRPATEKPAPALTMKDFNTLLDASVAAGIIPAKGDDTPSFEAFDLQRAVVVLRMSSADGLALLRQKVLGRLPNATVEKVRGVEVTTAAGLSYVVSGRTVAIGPRESVVAVVETIATDARRLGDEPGYVSAVAKHATGQNQIFAYTSGPTIARSIGAMFGVRPARAEEKPSDPRAAMSENAMRSFAGLEAIQGLGLGVRVDGDTLKVRYDFEVDRSRAGLVATLADPPPLVLRAAAFLPADAERVTGLSVDLTRIYDLLEQAFGPLPPAYAGGKTFAQEVAEMEENLGVSIRSELLPALGTEFALTGTLDSFFGGRGAAREGVGRPLSVLIGEVRNAEVVRRALTRLVMGAQDAKPLPPMDYKGVELYQGPGVAVAFVSGFGIVGEPEDVKRCIDAHLSGQTLMKSGEFIGQSGSWAGDALMATYEAASYREAVEKADAKMREAMGADGMDSPAPYLLARGLSSAFPSTIHRDGTGVHWEGEVPTSLLSGVGEMLLKEVLASSKSAEVEVAREPESDARMVGTLRMLASAEATFQSRHDRFATLEELVDEQFLDSSFAGSLASAGYDVQVSPLGTGDGATFQILATPVDYGKSGKLSFYIDHSYVIRAADKQGDPAGAGDPPLGYGGESEAVEVMLPPPDVEEAKPR